MKSSLPFYTELQPTYNGLREQLTNAYRMGETESVTQLVDYINFSSNVEREIAGLAKQLVNSVRENQSERSDIESFMLQYDLSMEEGILMMCLAEALLRIPDKDTERLLLEDKLTSANWNKHIGDSESAVVNMATWGLALSGKILNKQEANGAYFGSVWRKLIRRSGEPVIRKIVRMAMKILSKQFVIGQKIEEAIKQSGTYQKQGYTFSYDMLGEVARTQLDADRYYKAYYDAISILGKHSVGADLIKGSSISVKLSALHPLYNFADREVVVPYLIERVKTLALHAKENNISLTIDAEEADRLDMSLDIIEAVFRAPEFANWEGLGLALQAYQKRAFYVIDWLIELAKSHKKRIQVRLVKGAYWDTEVKLAQVEGFSGYPVFTRKDNTDISYLACAKKMLQARDSIYPQFATHNAYSVSAILTLLGEKEDQHNFEFQSLQGMGRALHNEIVAQTGFNIPCRIYAPVGTHEDLLPYLVRRLLENGANSSFVNRINDPKCPVETLIKSPLEKIKNEEQISNPHIPLPQDIYMPTRPNSKGMDLSNQAVLDQFAVGLKAASEKEWVAAPFMAEVKEGQPVTNPADNTQVVGHVQEAGVAEVDVAMQNAQKALSVWSNQTVTERADVLRKVADLMELRQDELMYLAINEAGKTLQDAISEVREAVDFCRYYAEQAEKELVDKTLPGPTGELNLLKLRARGVMLCISPWNFPLAIFTGQIAACLAAGNAVIAKPAEQTPLIAALCVKLFHEAGLTEGALQLLPGRGETIGQRLVEHPNIAGVLFTGSNATASAIARSLANRPGPILPLVAETGGINAMIADSSALHEQLVRDVVLSAFGSAGQRCSALRLLCVQEDIADDVIAMLKGAMTEIEVGNPLYLKTHVGPVIDEEAQTMLRSHIESMKKEAELIYEVSLGDEQKKGTFVAPCAFLLKNISQLKQEVFGPVLHVVRYKSKELDQVIEAINGLGFGLTFGIQSRINSTIDYIQSRIKVGNIYVNRNMIGAVVGVQPFGGSRLSGTGPKAGGPHYLPRLCEEFTVSVDTTAVGGNASLMAMDD